MTIPTARSKKGLNLTGTNRSSGTNLSRLTLSKAVVKINWRRNNHTKMASSICRLTLEHSQQVAINQQTRTATASMQVPIYPLSRRARSSHCGKQRPTCTNRLLAKVPLTCQTHSSRHRINSASCRMH